MKRTTIEKAYSALLTGYGSMGWWPLVSKATLPGFDDRGYHRGDFLHPESDDERFEIALGAILTQNTAWKNVEIVLRRMNERGLLTFLRLARTKEGTIAEIIRPCGYFNQKAKKIRFLIDFLGPFFSGKRTDAPARDELLGVWGIGEETADSILLYAYGKPTFVVDAYTKRIFGRIGLVSPEASYGTIQKLCHTRLDPDARVFNEYHALIVEHAKRYCRKTPVCGGCVFESSCPKHGVA
jgi:endonuclease-3 related protein